MKLTIWGARGSIPVSGPEYVEYGGDTTCIEIETADGAAVVFDAGSGLRGLGNKLMAEGRREVHFLLSHAHWDHLLGFPFFKPLYQPGVVIRFHGCTYAQQSVRAILKETMRAPFFPVEFDDVAAELRFDDECLEQFDLAGMECHSIPLSHPNNGYGFRVTEHGRSLALFPDNELTYLHRGGRRAVDYRDFVSGVDLLIHDGEYLPEEYQQSFRGWGHSVFTDTVDLALDARVGQLVLWHLNQDRDDAGVTAMARAARERIAAAGETLACEVARTGRVLELT